MKIVDLQIAFDKNTKEVVYDGEEVIVSNETFQSLLFDEDGEYVSALAENLDEQIFFYLPDDTYALGTKEIEEQLIDLIG